MMKAVFNIKNKIMYNQEGYYDPTAGKAIANIQKGEKIMRLEDRTGEIWKYRLVNSTSDLIGLVIADNGNIVTVIRLIDEGNDKHDLCIKCHGLMYGSSRMIQYTFNQHLSEYIRTLTKDELEEVRDKISESLDICKTVVEVPKDVVNDITPSNAEPNNVELEKVKAQLNVYKDLYNDLLNTMLRKDA